MYHLFRKSTLLSFIIILMVICFIVFILLGDFIIGKNNSDRLITTVNVVVLIINIYLLIGAVFQYAHQKHLLIMHLLEEIERAIKKNNFFRYDCLVEDLNKLFNEINATDREKYKRLAASYGVCFARIENNKRKTKFKEIKKNKLS